jgi:hypothetical protein
MFRRRNVFPVRKELNVYILFAKFRIPPVLGGNKYRNLALQVGGVSISRQ